MQAEELLIENPSLRTEVDALVAGAVNNGVELAIQDLEEHAEISATDYARVRRGTYGVDEILGDWFPPEPPRDGE